MVLTTRSLCIYAVAGLALSSSLFAAPGKQKPVPPVKKDAANKTGQWAEKKSACEALTAHAKELGAQEKQLRAQAAEKRAEEKALVTQAKQVDAQLIADEHSARKGQQNHAAESQLKSQHAELEHQATEKAKEGEALTKQADELLRQQRAIELQHKQECEGAGLKQVK